MPTIEQLERLLEADPNDAFVLYGLAQEHAKAGRHDTAIEYYDRVVAVDAGELYAYYHKALSQRELDREDEAIATLRAGVERARAAGDPKALGELSALLDEIMP